MAGQPLLRVSDLALSFGGVVALAAASFDVEERSIVGLIGPNGAGKTTLFNCISRLYVPDRGDIRFRGRSILRLPPTRIAALGIARTFQNLALFPSLSVLDNVHDRRPLPEPERLSVGRAAAALGRPRRAPAARARRGPAGRVRPRRRRRDCRPGR